MLTRIYIDNFKGLVDFELKDLGAINLFLGENGAGKSTVFEALRFIKMIVTGENILFETGQPYRTNSTQQQEPDQHNGDGLSKLLTIVAQKLKESHQQTFELDIESNQTLYRYKLIFEQSHSYSKVITETLHFNQTPLLVVESAEAKIYNDYFSLEFTYPFQSTYSLLNTLPQKSDNTRLIWFREQFQQWLIIQPIPSIMSGLSRQAEPYLDYEAKNFTSWYRYLCEQPTQAQALNQSLQDALPWLQGLHFSELIEHLSLYVELSHGTYHFSELSDGQRVLILLYTLLFATRDQNYLLCLDEPENYLALPEIQPWLMQLEEQCETQGLQAMLISHHPKLINYLGGSSGYWFSHEEGQPVTVKRLSEPDPSGVSLSELIARGWLDNELD